MPRPRRRSSNDARPFACRTRLGRRRARARLGAGAKLQCAAQRVAGLFAEPRKAGSDRRGLARVVRQGQSVIQGERLTVNLTTGVSHVEGGKGGGGRVKGLFMPSGGPAAPAPAPKQENGGDAPQRPAPPARDTTGSTPQPQGAPR